MFVFPNIKYYNATLYILVVWCGYIIIGKVLLIDKVR